jgi:hypothetical protein
MYCRSATKNLLAEGHKTPLPQTKEDDWGYASLKQRARIILKAQE